MGPSRYTNHDTIRRGYRPPFPRVMAILCAAAIGACTVSPPRLDDAGPGTSEPDECVALFERDDAVILHAGVRDAEYRPIAGAPFLRSSRFAQSLGDRLAGRDARAAWLSLLAAYDRESRSIEHRNLEPPLRPSPDTVSALERCRENLVARLLSDPAAFSSLLQNVEVQDNYSTWQRALGLYPLSSRFVRLGVARLHAREARYFGDDRVVEDAAVRRYGIADPPAADAVAGIVAAAPRDTLGMPLFDEEAARRLFAAHAPVFAVRQNGTADRIGRMRRDGSTITVGTGDPAMYTYLTYTHFAGTILTQLNYTVWFPERPARSGTDIYAGWLDGITWRVTLDSDGSVLIADVMHNCGCYYMAFPGPRLHRREGSDRVAEPLWIPRGLPAGTGGRLLVFLSDGEHYVRGLGRTHTARVDDAVRLLPYTALKQLGDGPGARLNLFEPDGLVRGSDRAERFLLWPMGVASAGAMREAGHHAIAFVGRRHFDDPHLLDRYFESAAGAP